jgi:uncharacterized membrane protein
MAVIEGQRISMRSTDRFLYTLSRYWMLFFAAFFGAYAGLPFLAPLFMHWGWIVPAKAIYFIYSFLCHQLPERSFFLFGPKAMYSLGEVQAVWENTLNPAILRRFIGSAEMGWKVAWSDRMVSMYVALWIFGILWWLLRRRTRPLSWWGLILFLLPMAVDGFTHFVSDLAGIEQGYRYSNQWLAVLTQYSFPRSFYVGNALGSFNAWMRLLTGFLFGAGVVWFSFPILDSIFSAQARWIRHKADDVLTVLGERR